MRGLSNMKNVTGSDLRSNLSKARGLGSAKHGVMHWWLQRVTAVALIPLTIWFMTALVSVMISPDILVVARWFAAPSHALLITLLLVAMFYHAKLGLQVVIEDYIHCPCKKFTLLLANSFFCFGGAALCIIVVLKMHFLNIA
jgi:succinate dehydrogenase / fumarate reductase membrane anchor subunit